MLILLDTTALVSDPLCVGVAWRVLVHAQQSWGVRVAISDVSVVETIAGYRRRLEEAVLGLDRWASRHAALGLDVEVQNLRQNFAERAADYPERLASALADAGVEVLAIPGVAHLTLVERATRCAHACIREHY